MCDNADIMQQPIVSSPESASYPTFQDCLTDITETAAANLFPRTDMLALIGHSSVYDGPEDKPERWFPSPLVQEITHTGQFWPDGTEKTRRLARGVSPASWKNKENDVGGGRLVVAAVAHFVEGISDKPHFLFITGGKPGYLDRIPNSPAEGPVLQKALARQIPEQQWRRTTVVATYGKNTNDDANAILTTAKDCQCRNVTIVAMGLRLPRLKAFLDALMEDPQYEGITVTLLPAELIMGDLSQSTNRFEQWRNLWNRFTSSPSYSHTLQDEEAGYLKQRQKAYTATGDR